MQGQTLKVCLDLFRGEKLGVTNDNNTVVLTRENCFAMSLVYFMVLRVQMLYLL
ncbi:hypothetical protein [Algoriphagus sanaruensis]|uniref:Uncharacterized protein n=1 Tax=Algoriphagus sanaruensis TaxID=1727163 RepID=A0A142EPD8_9BACT|nr:hypothetical protein [Algoriphagus sanaruensis]AMQ56993.1 hypothetical protein AO498_11167 [Algoriphagus sanaruensis]